MGDRRIACELKEKVLISYVTPIYMYGLETMALMEKNRRKCRYTKTTGYEGQWELRVRIRDEWMN